MNHQDEIKLEYKKLVTRRHFFKDCGIGLGSLALANLLTDQSFAQANPQSKNPLAPKAPHALVGARLEHAGDKIVFRAPERTRSLMGETPRKRLEALAAEFGAQPEERYE